MESYFKIKPQEISLSFNKVPKLVYVNETGYGCGIVYFYGKRVPELVSADIHSHTRADKGFPPLNYDIVHMAKTYSTHYEDNRPIQQVIEHYREHISSDPKYNSQDTKEDKLTEDPNQLTVNVNLKDTECIQSIIAILVALANDNRIRKNVKKEYLDKIYAILYSNPTHPYNK